MPTSLTPAFAVTYSYGTSWRIQICEKLRDAIKQKRHAGDGKLSLGVWLLHTSGASSQMTCCTAGCSWLWICSTKPRTVQTSLPVYYYLFRNLNINVIFVKASLQTMNRLKLLLKRGLKDKRILGQTAWVLINSLAENWQKCTDAVWDYIEKWHYMFESLWFFFI